MNSSVGLGRASEERFREALTADLRLVEQAERRAAAGRIRHLITACEALADLLTIALAVMTGYAVYHYFALGKQISYPPHTILGLSFAFALVLVLMLDRAGAYRRGNSLLRVRETEQILRVSLEAFLVVLGVSFFTGVLFSRWLLTLCLTLVPLSLFVQKTLMYLLIQSLHSKGYGVERVLIYGSGVTGRRVFSVLTRSPRLGMEPVALVDDDPSKVGSTIFELGYERRRCAQVIRGPVKNGMIRACSADLIIIAIPSIGRDAFLRTVQEAFIANARVSFVPSQFFPSAPMVDYQDIDGVLLASFDKSARRLSYEITKRLSDFFGSLTILVLGAPLFALLALLVKLDSPGPVLFRQERVGKDGKRFAMFKFRTMHAASDPYDFSPQASSDPRITRVGRFLRKTSLDEVPQIFNVLQGDMSLVGPRPEMPFIVDQYNDLHRRRLQVKPGLTGLWQLSGDRAFQIHENVEYDLYYIRYRNFFMDLAIMLHTTIFAMRGI